MGPPGLRKELQQSAQLISGHALERLLEGSAVAVDGAVWLYEAQTQEQLTQAFGPVRAALKVFFERCVRWLRKGVLPVVVFEGSGGGRAQRRCTPGQGRLGPAFLPQPKVRALLQALGVPHVDAEGEAEATCAALACAGLCDFVATTDFDAVLFGAPRVLRGLDLSADRATSRCELWEAAAIERASGLDRNALIAAAFLVGSDYDQRSKAAALGWAPAVKEAGLKGIGPRRAVAAAKALRDAGGTDAISCLQGLLAGQGLPASASASAALVEEEEERALVPLPAPASSSGRGRHKSPKKRLSRLARGVGKKQKHVAATALLGKIEEDAAKDPRILEGFLAVVRQYTRTGTQGPARREGFAWTGVDEASAQAMLSEVYHEDARKKLEPLHLEWILRMLAAEQPRPTALQGWARKRGFRYAPVSAKTPKPPTGGHVPYALVKWDPLTEVNLLKELTASVRHTRVSLAEKCGLLVPAGEENTSQQLLERYFLKASTLGPAPLCDASEDVAPVSAARMLDPAPLCDTSEDVAPVSAARGVAVYDDVAALATPPRRVLGRRWSRGSLTPPQHLCTTAPPEQAEDEPATPLPLRRSAPSASRPESATEKLVARGGADHRGDATDADVSREAAPATPCNSSRRRCSSKCAPASTEMEKPILATPSRASRRRSSPTGTPTRSPIRESRLSTAPVSVSDQATPHRWQRRSLFREESDPKDPLPSRRLSQKTDAASCLGAKTEQALPEKFARDGPSGALGTEATAARHRFPPPLGPEGILVIDLDSGSDSPPHCSATAASPVATFAAVSPGGFLPPSPSAATADAPREICEPLQPSLALGAAFASPESRLAERCELEESASLAMVAVAPASPGGFLLPSLGCSHSPESIGQCRESDDEVPLDRLTATVAARKRPPHVAAPRTSLPAAPLGKKRPASRASSSEGPAPAGPAPGMGGDKRTYNAMPRRTTGEAKRRKRAGRKPKPAVDDMSDG